MKTKKADVFFSCSFDEADKAVNEYFLALCRGLGFNPINVSSASALTPPAEAKRLIDQSLALIAVCTRRDELKTGKFIMPVAVHDEISFAYGRDTPVILFVEEGVELKGFKTNFGTYGSFDRDTLTSPSALEAITNALNELRSIVFHEEQIGASPGISDAYAEYARHRIELKHLGDEFTWELSTSKKLVYTHTSKRSFPTSVWANVPVDAPADTPPIEWQFKMVNSSRSLELNQHIEKHTSGCIDVLLKPSIPAEEGDFVEFTTVARSRYVNPVWFDETPHVNLDLEGCDACWFDGVVFLHRTKRATVEFRFPPVYGLRKSDVRPFVGCYTTRLDFEVPSELQRTHVTFEDMVGDLTVRLEIESPLPGHLYGIAWTPPPRPS